MIKSPNSAKCFAAGFAVFVLFLLLVVGGVFNAFAQAYFLNVILAVFVGASAVVLLFIWALRAVFLPWAREHDKP